jgi:transposase
MRSKGSAAELERKRLLAVRRVADGHPAAAVARFLEVHERTVRGWCGRHAAGGAAALAAKPHAGPTPRLTPAQEAEVLSWVGRNPTEPEFGFPTEAWTADRVAGLIRRRFGVTYRPAYVLRWLRRRGVTPQAVRRRPRGHDAGEQARWAAEEWPRILKKRPSPRPAASPAGSPG